MFERLQFYVDGAWVDPVAGVKVLDVINPATEQCAGRISLGSAGDVDAAAKAARTAFAGWSTTTRDDRLAMLERVRNEYEKRFDEIAAAITIEMGSPSWLSRHAQAAMGTAHLQTAIEVLENYRFSEQRATTTIVKEPIGVCGFITPWNWPINQIVCKVAPALAVGCTMILKPSEIAPFSAMILAEVLHAAGLPKGVFNLVNGDGASVGEAISRHPDVDMVSITGSTRAGIAVAKAAADTVKRVHQELGGKSPHIVLDDADLAAAVTSGVTTLMINSGQSCNAPARMLVPRSKMREAAQIAKTAAEALRVGPPEADVQMGPVASEVQWQRVQRLIQAGIDQGATLVTGGTGRPDGLDSGYYARPTIFADVTNDMRIAREEIFGPVLAMIPYDGVEEAIQIGNDTPYGLAAYVHGRDQDVLRRVANALRVGQVVINGASPDIMAPFGGYKQSGNGREWGDHAFAEFLEIKSLIGASA